MQASIQLFGKLLPSVFFAYVTRGRLSFAVAFCGLFLVLTNWAYAQQSVVASISYPTNGATLTVTSGTSILIEVRGKLTSNETFNYAHVYVDGVAVSDANLEGEDFWAQATLPFGVHTLKVSGSTDSWVGQASITVQVVPPKPLSQSITLNPISPKIFGAAPFTVSAVSSSKLAVTLSSLSSSVCTLSGSTVTLRSAGICTIAANQAGNAPYYAPAPQLTQSFAVASSSLKSPPTVRLRFPYAGTLSLAPGTTTYPLPVAGSVAVSSGTTISSVSVLNNGTVIASLPPGINSNGTVNLAIGTYNLALLATDNLGVSTVTPTVPIIVTGGEGISQTISFSVPNSTAYYYNMVASATSGLPVSFRSLTPAVCTITGNQVNSVAAGVCMVAANQAGDATYAPAAQVVKSFTMQVLTVSWCSPPSGGLIVGSLTGGQVWGNNVEGYLLESDISVAAVHAGLLFPGERGAISVSAGGKRASVSEWTANGVTTLGEESTEPNLCTVTLSRRYEYAEQTVAFAPLGSKTLNTSLFAIAATSTSNLAVSFSSLTPNICTVSGTTVSLAAVGTCSIAADQMGDLYYGPAPQVVQSFPVSASLILQSITFNTLIGRVLGDAPFMVSATSTTKLPVSFSATTPSVCTVAGSTVTLAGNGVCTITANQYGTETIAPATPVTRSFSVALPVPKSQSISLAPLAGKEFGDLPFSVTATSTSGLAVVLSSTTPSVCTILDSSVTLVAAGDCTIAANQTGNVFFSVAPQVTQTFTVARLRSQTISFAPLSGRVLDTSVFSISATSSSKLPVAFISKTPAICGVSRFDVELYELGTCTIAANQPGDSVFAPAPEVTQSFEVKISGECLVTDPSGVYTTDPNRGVVFGNNTDGYAVGSDLYLAGKHAGLIAGVAGNVIVTPVGMKRVVAGTYSNNVMTETLENTCAVRLAKGPDLPSQTITFTPIGDKPLGTLPLTVSAKSTSNLTVEVRGLTPAVCGLFGHQLSLKSTGTCTIAGTQVGDTSYSAAPEATYSFQVTPSQQSQSQTISFAPLPDKPWGAPTFEISATSSSSLNVSFSSLTPTVCSVWDSGGGSYRSTVTVASLGTCTVAANQRGDATYFAAPQVTQSFSVVPAVQSLSQTIRFDALPDKALDAQPFRAYAYSSTPSLYPTVSSLTPSVCSVFGGMVTPLAIGTCTLAANHAGNSIYFAAPQVTKSLSIVAAGVPGCGSKLPPSGYHTGRLDGGNVWGSNTGGYASDSEIGMAAVHAGLLAPGVSGFINVTSLDLVPEFPGSVSNGVTSRSFSSACGMRLSAQTKFAGAVTGVRAEINGSPQVVGWACRESDPQAVNFQVSVNAPLSQGGILLGAGIANVSTEAGFEAVATECRTPGAAHHFTFDLTNYASQYPDSPLYVNVAVSSGVTQVLSCTAPTCNVPTSMRIGFTTLKDNDEFVAPAPVFLRAKVTGVTSYDGVKVAFLINGNWSEAGADSEVGTYYAQIAAAPASEIPYLVTARVTKGSATLYTREVRVYVRDAGSVSVSLSAPKDGASIPGASTLSLRASVGATVAAVKFFNGGVWIANGVNSSGNDWTASWTTPSSGAIAVTARAFDANGAVVGRSIVSNLAVVGTNAGSSTPIPVAITSSALDQLIRNPDAGTLPGSLGVGEDGAATYSIALAVPPGTAGMAPELSLNYSSLGANGMVGLGWSLGGLSVIHRCGKTIAQDGIAGRIAFDGADRLCLDGQRLLRSNTSTLQDADAAYWEVGAQYRTERETFTRVTRLSNGGFKAETKSGLIQWYGIDAGSAIAGQGRTDGQALVWALARTEDRSSNFMTYEYSQNAVTGEYLPTQIRYGGNGLASQPADIAVRFEYADRGDQQRRYIGGSRNDLMKRLTHVTTFIDTGTNGAGGTMVRDNIIEYKESASSGRSMVESVQVCADNPDAPVVRTCLPKTVFSWGGGGPAALTTLPGEIKYPVLPYANEAQAARYADYGYHMQGDLNGSGRTAFITARMVTENNSPGLCGLPGTGPCSRTDTSYGLPTRIDGFMRIRMPDGVEFDQTIVPKKPDGGGEAVLQEITQYMLGDLNGDGRDDLVVVFDYWVGTSVHEAGWNYCLNTPAANGTFTFVCQEGGYGPQHHAPTMVDLQADRRMDLMMQGDASNLRQVCSFPNGVKSCSARTVSFTSAQPMLLNPMSFSEVGLSAQGSTDLFTTWRSYSPVAAGGGDSVYGHWPDGWGYKPVENTTGVAICLNDKQGNYLCDKIFAETSHFPPGMAESAGVFGVQAVGDINGDALADFIYTVANSPTNNGNYVCLSKETGVDCKRDATLDNLVPASATSQGGKLGDYLGDGMTRFLVTSADKTTSQLCRYTLGGMVCQAFPYSNISDSYNAPVYLDQSGVPVFAELTSVLQGDWNVLKSTLKTFAAPVEQDRLTGVVNGLGHREEVDYARASDAEVYQHIALVNGVEKRPVYPQLAVPPGVLVKQLRNADGQDGWLRTGYRYEGAMADAQGRGSLGFARIQISDQQTGSVTETLLRQDYPYAGMIASRTVVRAGVTLESQSVQAELKTLTLASGAQTTFPYVKQMVSQRRDLGGASLGITTTTNEYDNWGNQTALSADMVDGAAAFHEVTGTAFTNNETAWLLGLATRATVTRSATGVPAVTRTTDLVFDPATGLIASTTLEPDSPAYRVKTEYGRAGNVFGLVNTTTTSWINPSANAGASTVRETRYDPKGRFQATVLNALGHAEQFAYAAGSGARRRFTSANNLTSTSTSDGFGREKATVFADGTEIRKYYKQCLDDCPANAAMAVVSDTFNGGVRSSTPAVTYTDSAGHVVRTSSWGMDRELAGAPGNAGAVQIVRDFQYDARGRLVTVFQPRFVNDPAYLAQRSGYDDFDRVVSSVTLDDDGSEKTETVTYTGFVTVSLKEGQSRTEQRNMLGKLVSVVDARGGETTFEYDAFGNLASTRDPNRNEIKVTYDRLGRKTDLRDPNLGWTHYDVDPLGQVWRLVSPLQRAKGAAACFSGTGTATCFRYDKLGRMVLRDEPDLQSTWVYDTAANGIGALAETYTGTAAAPDYRRVHTYDSLGRQSTTTRRLYDVSYAETPEYDSWGRLIRQTYQRGADAPKVYDLRYNDKDVLVRLERAGMVLWSVNQKDAARRLRMATLGNGLIQHQEFNVYSARLQGTGLNKADNTSMLQLGYEYDALGNLSGRSQYWDPVAGQNRPGFRETFHYDALNRLKDSQVDGKALQEFSYDAAGNITGKTGNGVYGYTADGANAVQSISSLGAFTYDGNGNLKTGAGRTMTWTSYNMPQQISKGMASASFAYGPEHQRTRQDRSDGVTVVYAGAQEVEMADGQVASVKTFWPTGNGFEIDRPGVPTELLWIHRDRLGSPIAYSADTGALKAEKLAYDAWGKRRAIDGSATPDNLDGTTDSRGYTDHEMLDQLDLVHMNGRVYDPRVGRFLSADPTVPDPANGQSHNRYAYVLNNPTNLTDPSGYTPECTIEPCVVVPNKRPPSWFGDPFEAVRAQWTVFNRLLELGTNSMHDVGQRINRSLAAQNARTAKLTGIGMAGSTMPMPRGGAGGAAAMTGPGLAAALGAMLLEKVIHKDSDDAAPTGTDPSATGPDASGAKGGSAGASPPPPDEDKDNDLSKEDRKSIRSLEKQIEKHEQKLAEFKNNSTVRPGMENQPKEVIEAQRATRIRHLETEIRTFQNNIDKIRGGQ